MIGEYIFTSHAETEIRRRGLEEAIVRKVVEAPEQQIEGAGGRVTVQSRVSMQNKLYLVRVVVDTGRMPAQVVTAYRTSKIGKYWRKSP